VNSPKPLSECARVPVAFEGTDTAEVARNRLTGAVVLRVNPKYYRPVDPARLVGNPAKASQQLGWTARLSGPQVAAAMVEAESGALSRL